MEVWGVDIIVFSVGDLTQAVQYYERMGLKLAFRSDQVGVLVFEIGAESPKLLLTKEGPISAGPGAPRLWLEVSDVLAVAQELKEKGCRFVREPFQIPTGWLTEVADPWGNVIGFTDYATQPEFGRANKRKIEKA